MVIELLLNHHVNSLKSCKKQNTPFLNRSYNEDFICNNLCMSEAHTAACELTNLAFSTRETYSLLKSVLSA